MNDLELCLEVA